MATPFNVETVRKDFPNLHIQVRGRPLVYLDNAATTLKPASVIEAVDRHYRTGTSNVHRGVHYLSEQATAAFEETREKMRALINAAKTEEIVFTNGATDAINLVAQSFGRAFLQKEDEILITEMEHHSNIVPWQLLCDQIGCRLKVAPINDAGELIWDAFLKMIGERTKLIAAVFISNSLGTVNPVADIVRAAHERDIPVLIDAAQAISHTKVDVRELDCDFLTISAHKMFGPSGVGVLYGKERWLAAMPPYQGGGDMISAVTFEKTTYNVLPYKFEAGTPNIAGVIGFGAAIDYFNALDIKQVAAHETELLAYGTKSLAAIDGLQFIGTARNKTAILSFVLPDVHPHDLGTLVDREGVAIRTGHHCTQPVMRHFHLPATSRASLAMYNTPTDIDRLVEAIHTARNVFK